MDTFVVTMYRFGDREKHSYVLGVYDNQEIAETEADKETNNRGGKYRPEVIRCPINVTSDDVQFDVVLKLEPCFRRIPKYIEIENEL